MCYVKSVFLFLALAICGVGHKCPLWRNTFGVLWRQAFSLLWRVIKQFLNCVAIKEVYLRRHKAHLLAPLCLLRHSLY